MTSTKKLMHTERRGEIVTLKMGHLTMSGAHTAVRISTSLLLPLAIAAVACRVRPEADRFSTLVGMVFWFCVVDCVFRAPPGSGAKAAPNVVVAHAVVRRMLPLVLILGAIYVAFVPDQPLKWLLVMSAVALAAVACFGAALLFQHVIVDKLGLSLILAPALLWFSPILYDMGSIPRLFQSMLYVNPILPFFRVVHGLMQTGGYPPFRLWLWMMFWSAGAVFLGMWLPRKLSEAGQIQANLADGVSRSGVANIS